LLTATIPHHVGIIPDGNRRWARKNGVSFAVAYNKGYEVLKEILKYLLDLGVKYVSVYVMSRDNCLKRSNFELKILNDLAYRGFRELRNERLIKEKKVSVRVIGDLNLVEERVRKEINKTVNYTAKFRERTLYLAVCYGVRWEIEEAIKNNKIPFSLTIPMIDLVIRTGGRRRLSDFLPIPASYAELYFTDTLWPDFNKEELIKALEWYKRQERLFGR
jgi:tritrans,polycis-undecaprenyl-diphosphate synthase [geranylgeranyl-diphosphate specific]